jgi:hypothetical protein
MAVPQGLSGERDPQIAGNVADINEKTLSN